MKRLFCAILLTTITVCMLAVPVLRVRLSIMLDTGEKIFVTAYGDEDFSYLLSDDGTVVTRDGDTYHDTGLTPDDYLTTLPQRPMQAQRRVGSLASALIKPTGRKQIPVILAAFQDKPFGVAATDEKVNAYYDRYFNGMRDGSHYDGAGSYGSVSEYFADQSQEQFLPEFTVIGPVVTDNGYKWYGEDSGSSNDIRYGSFVQEVLTKARAMHSDWTAFDNDGNGKVDMCVIIFAGMGQNYTNSYGDPYTIWPKENPATYNIGDVTISGITSAGEMRPTKAANNVITDWQPDGIGVVVHEISHALGLPDLYDTRNKAFGLDYWSIMDFGQYAGNCYWPVGYTAYEREFVGWQQTETVSAPTTLHLKPFARGGKGYKIVNEANPDEYYILDNRQPAGWDEGLCRTRGHGMLVMHIDYLSSSWTSNRVNTDPDHQRATIIPANGTLIGSNNYKTSAEWKASLQGNPYPGLTDNHSLTDTTNPASVVFTGGLMHKPLVDIEELEDGTVTVKVMPLGTLEPPTEIRLTDVDYTKAQLQWKAATNAEAYNLRLLRDGQEVQRVDSIRTESYLLTDLKADADYVCQLQAISDSYRNSEWTEGESFRANPDAVTDITQSTTLVRIFDIRGRYIGQCYRDEVRRLISRPGIYVIRDHKNKAHKLFVKP